MTPARPAKDAASGKPERSREPTPFERFTELARRVLSVPKSEVDKQRREWRRRQRNKKRR